MISGIVIFVLVFMLLIKIKCYKNILDNGVDLLKEGK